MDIQKYPGGAEKCRFGILEGGISSVNNTFGKEVLNEKDGSIFFNISTCSYAAFENVFCSI